MSGLATYLGVTKTLGITADEKLVTEMLFGAIMNDNSANEDGVYHWKMMAGGTLAYDGQGWLVDEDGLYVNIDGTRTDTPKEGETLGAAGIETGLLNIIAGTSNKEWSSFSENERNKAQILMMAAGMQPLNPKADPADYRWATWEKGKKLDMNTFFIFSGEDAPEEIFKRYYGSLADLQLTQNTGLDLMFDEESLDKLVPGTLKDRFEKLKMEHLSQIPSFMSVKDYMHDKYLFTMDMEDGTKQDFLKVDKNNPYIDKLLGQHDISYNNTENDINYILNNSGCNAMTIISTVQLMTGTLFSEEKIKDIWKQAIDQKYVLSFDSGKAAGSVKKPQELSSLAFSYTDYKDFILDLGRSPSWDTDPNKSKGTVVATRIGVPYPATNPDPGHYTLGSLGTNVYYKYPNNILYNPGYSTGDHLQILEFLLYGVTKQ